MLGLALFSATAFADCAPFAYATCQPADDINPVSYCSHNAADPIYQVALNKCLVPYTYTNQCDCGNVPATDSTPQY
jgi:hypothetical protein